MKRSLVLLIFLALFGSWAQDVPEAAAAEESLVGKLLGVEVKKSPIEELADYWAPEGWMDMKGGSAQDPSLTFFDGDHHIEIELFGGEGSRFKTPEEFLKSPEAQSAEGETKEDRRASLRSTSVPLYRRKVRLRPPTLEDPYRGKASGRKPKIVEEEFCIVPAGERFFVLTYSYEGWTQLFDPEGEEAWRGFLKSFKALKR